MGESDIEGLVDSMKALEGENALENLEHDLEVVNKVTGEIIEDGIEFRGNFDIDMRGDASFSWSGTNIELLVFLDGIMMLWDYMGMMGDSPQAIFLQRFWMEALVQNPDLVDVMMGGFDVKKTEVVEGE